MSSSSFLFGFTVLLCLASIYIADAKFHKDDVKGKDEHGSSEEGGGFVPRMTVEDGSDDGSQKWGYVEVRPGAYLFWWMYHTTHQDGYMNRPWLIWMEGGPGDSGTQLANLGAIGPEDAEGNPRNASWVSSVSVLFIDSPVGVGFSYFDPGADLANTTEDTTFDVLQLYKVFTGQYEEFKELPLYIFGHSYGGRATGALAYFMLKARKRGELECNLQGIGMGNAWVSPPDSTLAMPPLLHHMGFVGKEQYEEMVVMADSVVSRMRALGPLEGPDEQLFQDYWAIAGFVPEMDYYNILKFQPSPPDTTNLINTVIKDKLRIIPSHVNISSEGCCDGLIRHDVFRLAYDWIDVVLKKTDVKVVVYQGNLDYLCATKGAMDWMDRLTWEGMNGYRKQGFVAIDAPGTSPTTDLYVRNYGQLSFYTVVNSGHYVTIEVPEVALHMLNRVIDDLDN